MATGNPFDLLGDDDTDDPSQLIAAQQQKIAPSKAPAPSQATAAAAQQQKQAAKLPSKPIPPSQAVREAKTEAGRGGGEAARGGGRGGGRGFGRGGRGGGGYNRDSTNNENSFSSSRFSGGQGAPEEADSEKTFEKRGGYGGPRPFRVGGERRHGSSSNGDGEEGERPRRTFERRSGTGRGNELKREGSGRGNWGTPTDELSQVTEEVNEGEKSVDAVKPSGEEDATDGNKENPATEPEEKEPEDKEMTLEEYEKVLEEKRKALQALKTEERKVDIKVFESMQQISSKKENSDVFIKLGSEKDKRKEFADKEEKAKKSVSINEFLKPAEGDRFYGGGRGRGGRGRGSRGGYSGGGSYGNPTAPSIEDPGQFPTLGAK